MRHLKKILGLLIGLVFLYLALRQVEFAKLPATLTSFQFWLIPVLLLSITIEQLLRVWRWQVILVGRPVGFWYLYAGMLLGYLANNVLPARAGEVVRCYYLGRKGQVFRLGAMFLTGDDADIFIDTVLLPFPFQRFDRGLRDHQ